MALGTRGLLLEHFKRFYVNSYGGLMVSKDMTRYVELLRSWDVDEHVRGANGALDVLLDVGNLFVIGPEALMEKMRAAQAMKQSTTTGARTRGAAMRPTGANLSATEIRAYVSKREDSGAPDMQSIFAP